MIISAVTYNVDWFLGVLVFQINDLLEMVDESCHVVTADIARVGRGAL